MSAIKKRRTDEEKRALVAEFNQVSMRERTAWLRKRKFSGPWFYKMRKQFIESAKPSVALVPYNGDRQALLVEYEAVPRGQKQRWLNERGLYSSWYTYAKKLQQEPSQQLASRLLRATAGGSGGE